MHDHEEKSALSRRIQEVKDATLNAAERRQGADKRLPQPLFWSLFHAELAEIKQQKAIRRLLDSVLIPK